MAANVLIVDDEEPVRRLELQVLERGGYRCTLAASTAEALARLEEAEFELALLDLNIRQESGLDLARIICREYPATAAMMVTGQDDPQLANIAREIGALGYVVKPFKPNELLIQVANALHRRQGDLETRSRQAQLEMSLAARTASLKVTVESLEQSQHVVLSSQEETILRLVRASEFRDDETGRHVQRMSRYCALLAKRLGYDAERSELVRLASILHDVGKIGIPDDILHKPGPLTADEQVVMRRHVEIGYSILVGSEGELLQTAAAIAWTHHEKYDGTGYPRGLASEVIPLEGRIAAIADVFDALTSDRVYRPAFSLDQTVSMMRENCGKHFDPALLEVFLGSLDDALAIQAEYSDG